MATLGNACRRQMRSEISSIFTYFTLSASLCHQFMSIALILPFHIHPSIWKVSSLFFGEREAKKEKLMLIENDNEKSIFKGRLMTVSLCDSIHLTSFNITVEAE